MDLKTLKTFQMIVKYGSFIRAADAMNYVQSTVTMQIQKLESELGVQLIERGKKDPVNRSRKTVLRPEFANCKEYGTITNELVGFTIRRKGEYPFRGDGANCQLSITWYLREIFITISENSYLSGLCKHANIERAASQRGC